MFLDYRIEVYSSLDSINVSVCWQNFLGGPYLPDPFIGSSWTEEIRDSSWARFWFGSVDDRIAKAIGRLSKKADVRKARAYEQRRIAARHSRGG